MEIVRNLDVALGYVRELVVKNNSSFLVRSKRKRNVHSRHARVSGQLSVGSGSQKRDGYYWRFRTAEDRLRPVILQIFTHDLRLLQFANDIRPVEIKVFYATREILVHH